MIAILIAALFIAGVILAAVDEVTAKGRSLTTWAVIVIGIGLIIWRLVE